MYGNTRPEITDQSHGQWRRLLENPFNVVIPKHLRVKNYWDVVVAEEGMGIQRLFIQAAVEYIKHGLLPVPKAITDATQEYRDAADPWAMWLAERTVQELDAEAGAQSLWIDYDDWCQRNRHRAIGSKSFYERLAQKFDKRVSAKRAMYLGVRTLNEDGQ
jgi:phage/plasmid-associated DNA primase